MNRFILQWSGISLICIGLIQAAFYSSWVRYPEPNPISISVCLAYWLLLAFLQKRVLFSELQNRQFGARWFITVVASGFLPMLLHDLYLLSPDIDPRGQGVLILYLTLPCLAFAGGLVSGITTLLLFKNYSRRRTKLDRLDVVWIIVNVFKWVVGITMFFYLGDSFSFSVIIIFLFAVATAIEGGMIRKYLSKRRLVLD